MAGYMYFNKKRVCPALLVGGGETWYNPEHFFIRFPDGETDLSGRFTLTLNETGVLTDIDFNDVEVISGKNVLMEQFVGNKGLGKVNTSGIKKITGEGGMKGAFLSAQFSGEFPTFDSLEEISGYMGAVSLFQESNISGSFRFPKLSKITGSVCLGLAFELTNIEHIYFDALTTQSFGSDTTQLAMIVDGVTGCTLHFPSNLSSVIPTLYDYPNFSGTNTVILYDLPATS